MTFLATLETKIEAVATKLGLEIHDIERVVHAALDNFLGIADEDTAAAKQLALNVIADAQAKAAAVETAVKTDVATVQADAAADVTAAASEVSADIAKA